MWVTMSSPELTFDSASRTRKTIVIQMAMVLNLRHDKYSINAYKCELGSNKDYGSEKRKLTGANIKSLVWTPQCKNISVGCESCGLEGFRVNESSSWAMSQKHTLVPTESLVTSGCVNERVVSRIKQVIISCYSAWTRPHLRPSVQLQALHFKGDVNKTMSRGRVVRIVKGLANPRRSLSTASHSLLGSWGKGSLDLFCIYV